MSSPRILPVLLDRFALRHARLEPRRTALLCAILALGVAVFISVRLANRAAVASFTHFTDTLTGQSDWVIQPAAGTFPQSLLPELREALIDQPVIIVPVVETTAARTRTATEKAGASRTTYTLLGVDLMALANLSRQQAAGERFFTSRTSTSTSTPG